jgi:tetratricopeptide (TPR) repeat protein
MDQKKEHQILIFGLAVSCLVLYFNSFWNAFAFDDFHTIVDNLYVKDLRYVPMFFKGYCASLPDITRGMFRPLLMLTFAMNYFFGGLSPIGFHIINTLIHFLNGVMLYVLLRTLRKDFAFGWVFLITLLFIFHPLNTEAVSYIACRSDLLVTFLLISAVITFLRKRLVFSVFLYALALLTKETALVYGFLIFACEFIFGIRSEEDAKGRRSRYAFYAVVILLTAAYWFMRGVVFAKPIQEALLAPVRNPVRGIGENILIQLRVSVLYLRLFFFPYPLMLDHYIELPGGWGDPMALFSCGVVGAAFALIVAFRKRLPLVSFGLCWYFIGLLPKFYAVLNFPAMEHHAYLPGIGLFLALAALLWPWYRTYRRKIVIVAAGILGIFTLMVWQRNYEWKTGQSLYESAVTRNPYSAVAHNNLGIQLASEGLSAQAEEEFKKGLSLSDSVAVQVNARINLAHIYANRKEYDEAFRQLNLALKKKPRYYEIYQALGIVYTQIGRDDEAEAVWLKGLSFYSRSAAILENLGLLTLKQERYEEARRYFERVLQLVPDSNRAYFYLGQIFEKENDLPQAIAAYEKSIHLNPSFALAHYCLGTLYAARQDSQALWHLQEAVKLNPAFPEAHNNLAVLYSSMVPPRLGLARYHAKKASSLGYPVDEEFLKTLDASGQQAPGQRTPLK